MVVSSSSVLFILTAHLIAAVPLASQDDGQEGGQDDNVPVTIKELDVAGAISEFKDFQARLGEFRTQISEGRALAQETSQILEELRSTASPENEYNEGKILEAVGNYVNGVVEKQIGLVDFLESQRYRISYYASKMASSVRPEHLALLFGTVEQNDLAITARVRSLEDSREQLAAFVDTLPDEQLDKETFRPLRAMPTETKRQLDALLYRYQQERGALEFAKKRQHLVRAAERTTQGGGAPTLDIDTDLLVGQMFGALDRVRLQMSMDLMFLENLLSGYAQSTRTQEIVEAFQSLIELQGDLEGPSPELAGVLDWLQDSSSRRLSMGAATFAAPGLDVPRYGDLLREAYLEARSQE